MAASGPHKEGINLKTELRKIFESAESDDRGLSAREIAAVINSIPAEERMARTEILAAVNGADGSDSPETRRAIAETLKYMEMRTLDAREDRARLDREIEARNLVAAHSPILTPVSADSSGTEEWRSLVPSLSEYRAISGGVPSEGGYTVPTEISGKYIDALKAKSTFLRGLPEGSVIPFTSATFSVPQLVSSTGADYVAEGQTIPEGQMVWGRSSSPPRRSVKCSGPLPRSWRIRPLISGESSPTTFFVMLL